MRTLIIMPVRLQGKLFVGLQSTDNNASTFIGSDVRHAHQISLGFIVAPRRVTPVQRRGVLPIGPGAQ